MLIRDPRPADTYVLIRRTALDDGTLSFKARGILAYLLALPPGSSTTPEKLAKHGTDGERAVKSGIKELEEAGYLLRDGVNVQATDVPGIVEPVQDELPLPPKGVGAPTPLQQLAPRGWRPTDRAIQSAKDAVEFTDVELFILHYRVRCTELKKQPNDAEFLRWLIEDEKKALAEERRLAKANGTTGHWYDTA